MEPVPAVAPRVPWSVRGVLLAAAAGALAGGWAGAWALVWPELARPTGPVGGLLPFAVAIGATAGVVAGVLLRSVLRALVRHLDRRRTARTVAVAVTTAAAGLVTHAAVLTTEAPWNAPAVLGVGALTLACALHEVRRQDDPGQHGRDQAEDSAPA